MNTAYPLSENYKKKSVFIRGIENVYRAEKDLAKVLPRMHKLVRSSAQEEIVEKKLAQTLQHILLLEDAFKILGIDRNNVDRSMKHKYHRVNSEKFDIRKKHSYRSLAHMADNIGEREVADILNKNLRQETETDKAFTKLSGRNFGKFKLLSV
jgi:ferritin-like metal-binding protein YciE